MEDPLNLNDLINHVLRILEKESEIKQIEQINNGDISIDTIDVMFLKYFRTKTNIEIKNENKNNHNSQISFLHSIMQCICPEFNTLSNGDKILYIDKCINKICVNLGKRNGINKYATPSFIWNKKSLISGFANKEFTEYHFVFIAVYFNINIFIIKALNDQSKNSESDISKFDKHFQDDAITFYTSNQSFNKFKQSIILYCENNKDSKIHYSMYSPIIINNKYIHSFDEPVFNNFITNNKIVVYQQNYFNGFNNIKFAYDYDIETIWENEYVSQQVVIKKEIHINPDVINLQMSDKSMSISSIRENKVMKQDESLHGEIDEPIIDIKTKINIDVKDKKDKEVIKVKDNKDNKDKEDKEDKEDKKDKKDKEDKKDKGKEIIKVKDKKDKKGKEIIKIKDKKIKQKQKQIKETTVSDISSNSGNDTNDDVDNPDTDYVTTEQAMDKVLNFSSVHQYDKQSLMKMKIIELKDLMRQHSLSLTVKQDNKIKQKVKSELISDLLKLNKN